MLRQKSFFLSLILALLLGYLNPVWAQVAVAAPDCGETYEFVISNYQYVFSYDGDSTPQQEVKVYSQSNDGDQLVEDTIQLVWEQTLCGFAANIGEQPWLKEWVKFDIDATPVTTTGQTGRWANVKGQLIRRDWIPASWTLTKTPDTFNILWCPSNLQAEVPFDINVVSSRQLVVLPGDGRSSGSSYWWRPDWTDLGGVCKQALFPAEDAPYLVGFGFPFAGSKGDSFSFPDDWLVANYQFGKFLRTWYKVHLPFMINGG